MKLMALGLMLFVVCTPLSLQAAGDDKPALAGVGGAAGIGQYPPSTWGVAATTIRNPTSTDQHLLVTFNFEETPTLQFAVDVWIPAKSRRSIWMPIRTNGFEVQEFNAVSLPLRQQLFDRSSGKEIELGQASGLITAARDRWITGMLSDADDADDDQISVALAMRRAVEYSQRMAYLNERALPTMVAGWQGMNGLVIAKEELALDSAQTQALRQWLLSGGKLWVMVDQIDPQVMAQLLGETWTVEVVDRVPLSTVKIESASAQLPTDHLISLDDELVLSVDGQKIITLPQDEGARGKALDTVRKHLDKMMSRSDKRQGDRFALRITGAVPGDVVTDVIDAVRIAGGVDAVVTRDHEKPVDFVRVLQRDFEVVHTVNGWPASLRKPVGKGWLMLTTLGSRGWMEPRLVPQNNVDGTEAKDDKGRRMMTRGYIAHRPMRDLADWFHQDRREQVLSPAAFNDYVGQQIGYSIVSRGVVLWVLAAFTLSLFGAGMWFSRSGRLEHLAWVGAAMALVVTLVLIVVGQANRSSVPMTVAQAQFVQIASDQQQASSNGLITIYNDGTGEANATLGSEAGGLILPADLSENLTRKVRMVWTDFDRWHWENIGMLSGANTRAIFEHVTPLNKPVDARLTFNDQGAVMRVRTGDLGAMSNLLIATPHGVLATRSGSEGALLSSQNDTLPAGQFSGAGVIDDMQRRRQDVLRLLMGQQQETAGKQGKSGSPSIAGVGIPGRQRSVPFPDRPTVLGWADALPMGFTLPDAKQQLGSALVSIPITIERPADGTKVAIPAAFLPYRVVRGIYGPTPAIFVEEQRIWNNTSGPGTLPLSFQIPRELLPIKLDGATFRLDIGGPNTVVEVLVERDGTLAALIKKESYDGLIEVAVPAGDLKVSATGEVLIVVRVGYMNPEERTLWQIRSVSLEVQGTTTAP